MDGKLADAYRDDAFESNAAGGLSVLTPPTGFRQQRGMMGSRARSTVEVVKEWSSIGSACVTHSDLHRLVSLAMSAVTE
jgi:hypothetical protein